MAGNDTHPSWAELDAVRAGEGEPQHASHVEICGSCQAVVARMEQLAAELRAMTRLPLDVPKDIDDRILWNARKRAQAARRDAQPVLRRLGTARWAIAAAVILALAAVGLWERTGVAPVQVAGVGTDDIDGNGKIDIRDAFLLAKAMDSRTDAALADEVDGDRFESSDVDRIARRAVTLGRRG